MRELIGELIRELIRKLIRKPIRQAGIGRGWAGWVCTPHYL